MSESTSLLPETVLRNYFHAKDENRPRILDSTFALDATLEVKNRTSAISFPARTVGRNAIADVLVRDFGKTYENVYSFYLSRPGKQQRTFTCDWLVAMTEKSTGAVRVGTGSYDWTFDDGPPHLATSLVITIASMQVLPASAMPAVFAWVSRLSYPWSSASEVRAAVPNLPEVQAVLTRTLGVAET
jgi:hypothetical protein